MSDAERIKPNALRLRDEHLAAELSASADQDIFFRFNFTFHQLAISLLVSPSLTNMQNQTRLLSKLIQMLYTKTFF